MHQIAFATKRAFHGFLRGTRKLFAAYGLTPARFDLLYAIVGGGPIEPHSSSYQSALRKQLGITAPVVSRMLGALERLGWIRREKGHGDRRQRIVRLTAEGRARMLAARRVVLRTVERIVTAAVCLRHPRDQDERLQKMDRLEGYLGLLRRDLGDRATLYFRWGHPDD